MLLIHFQLQEVPLNSSIVLGSRRGRSSDLIYIDRLDALAKHQEKAFLKRCVNSGRTLEKGQL